MLLASKNPDIALLVKCVDKYGLTVAQATALANASDSDFTWITQGYASTPGLLFDNIVEIASRLLHVTYYDATQIMLTALNIVDEEKEAVNSESQLKVSSNASGFFSVKAPIKQLDLIKHFIMDELCSNGLSQKGQFKEFQAGHIADRKYGFHLGIGANTGLAYVRDRNFSIEIKNGKACCAKAVSRERGQIEWKQMTSDEIQQELRNENSLIAQIANHQEAKQSSQHTPK
ncbi:hypothetical protein [uncultured Legionella sp.]|uniref:hypothetical protein n=1 Tax=uncultured Legionella sp. TaxID=210934 RepID=UPI00262E29EE|nr:hypothetical protein [uncultured Legionella sp.]